MSVNSADHDVSALKMALQLRRQGEFAHRLIHHSDRGGQHISYLYTGAFNSWA